MTAANSTFLPSLRSVSLSRCRPNSDSTTSLTSSFFIANAAFATASSTIHLRLGLTRLLAKLGQRLSLCLERFGEGGHLLVDFPFVHRRRVLREVLLHQAFADEHFEHLMADQALLGFGNREQLRRSQGEHG